MIKTNIFTIDTEELIDGINTYKDTYDTDPYLFMSSKTAMFLPDIDIEFDVNDGEDEDETCHYVGHKYFKGFRIYIDEDVPSGEIQLR